MTWIPVESSNLKAVRYNQDTKELDVRFHNISNDSFYRYGGVEETVYNYLIQHSGMDLGWYFERVVKGSYPTTRIDTNESQIPDVS